MVSSQNHSCVTFRDLCALCKKWIHFAWDQMFTWYLLDFTAVCRYQPDAAGINPLRITSGRYRTRSCVSSIAYLLGLDYKCEPTILCDWGDPNLYLDQLITYGQCQPVRGYVSTPTPTWHYYIQQGRDKCRPCKGIKLTIYTPHRTLKGEILLWRLY